MACRMMWMLVTSSLVSAMASAADGREWDRWQNALKPEGQVSTALTIASSGKSDYRIVTPATTTTQDAKAAQELQRWLHEMTGVELPLIREDTLVATDKAVISIGRTRRLEQSGLAAARTNLGDEGYGIAVEGSTLLLWGGRTRGSINAVWALLEEDLGCRWYTDEHVRIPRHTTLTFAPVPRTYLPQFKLRDPFYYVAFDEDWSLRNRTNAPLAHVREEWGGRMDYGGRFVHTFHLLVPPDKYFKQHPDYYMMNEDGKRDSHQLCTTNPDVVRLVVREVERFLKEHPHTEIVSVSKTDGGRTCLCPTCKTLDDAEGTHMAALLHLVNKVAEAIEEEHPHVLVSTLAYLETIKVPKTIRPRKNVAIRLCNDSVGSWVRPFTPGRECDFGRWVKAWSAAHDRIYIWDYTVNFSHFLAPMPNVAVIADNIEFLAAHNAEGIMTQGAMDTRGVAREWLRVWVIAKLMWDPSRDWRELMQDFIWGHYGSAAPAMAEYNALLRQQAEMHRGDLEYPPGGIRYEMDSPFLSKQFLDAASKTLDRAAQEADGEDVLHRVERDRLPIMYVKLMRGPAFVGPEYGRVLDRFETIARRVGVERLREGPPNLDEHVQKWRSTWEEYSAAPSQKQ